MHLPGCVGQTSLCSFVIWIVRQNAPVSCLSVGVMPSLQLGLAKKERNASQLWIERKRLPELGNCGVVLALGDENLSESKVHECFLRILLLQVLKKFRRFIQHSELQKNSSKFLLIRDVLRIRGIRLLQRRDSLGILPLAEIHLGK